jgi:hypothetical protein
MVTISVKSIGSILLLASTFPAVGFVVPGYSDSIVFRASPDGIATFTVTVALSQGVVFSYHRFGIQ